MKVLVFNQPGIYSFLCPSDWNVDNFKIECLGGGQGGQSPIAPWTNGGSGGGAGYYAYLDSTQIGPFGPFAPKPGDTLIITVADVSPPTLLSAASWPRGNPSSVFHNERNTYAVFAPGGQTNPLPIPPVGPIGGRSIKGAPGGLADIANNAFPGGCLGGDGGGGGAPGIITDNFIVDYSGGDGSPNEFGKGNPSPPYGLPGAGGASYYPPANEPLVHNNDLNLRIAVIQRNGVTISQGTNGAGLNWNPSDIASVAGLTHGLDGAENPIAAWSDTFVSARQMGLGGAGSGGRGWWYITDPLNHVPAPITNHPHDKAFILANCSGTIQQYSSYYGYNGGNGGRGAGAGGGGIGYTVNQGETGIGGIGGMGGVVISWGPTSLKSGGPNLIPLPWPRYARTERGLFYPWGYWK